MKKLIKIVFSSFFMVSLYATDENFKSGIFFPYADLPDDLCLHINCFLNDKDSWALAQTCTHEMAIYKSLLHTKVNLMIRSTINNEDIKKALAKIKIISIEGLPGMYEQLYIPHTQPVYKVTNHSHQLTCQHNTLTNCISYLLTSCEDEDILKNDIVFEINKITLSELKEALGVTECISPRYNFDKCFSEDPREIQINEEFFKKIAMEELKISKLPQHKHLSYLSYLFKEPDNVAILFYLSFLNSQVTKNISIDHLNITLLPYSVGKFSKLELLSITHCRLEAIPSTLLELLNLKKLYLNNNKLKNLPKNIGRLKDLHLLDLEGNDALTTLPESFLELNNLIELSTLKTGLLFQVHINSQEYLKPFMTLLETYYPPETRFKKLSKYSMCLLS